jgi:prepilin-type N-terminal cleavage/methylation domain-containing protein
MRRRQAGFTLTELLAVLFPISLIAAGAVGFFASHNRTYIQQDLAVTTEENLRAAMGMVSDTLRTAGCGVPKSNLGNWITWVSGFDNDPLVVTDGGDHPDTVSVAACAPEPIAHLSAQAAAGATSLSIVSDYSGTPVTSLLNASDKSLIWIGDSDHARVVSVSGTTIQIDTDPTAAGQQGLARAYLPGTPITRIDVFTFQVENDRSTGRPWMRIDKHRGTEDPAAEGIADLQVTTVTPGQRYRIALTARAETADPVGGQTLERTLSTDVRLRN